MTTMVPSHDRRNDPAVGARLYLFTVDEYFALGETGILPEDDPVELIEGLLAIKSDIVPPYGVPVGIPPREIWPEGAAWTNHPLRRLTVREYAKIVRAGILDPTKRHELIEGWLVEKMSRNPPHDYVLSSIQDLLGAALPADWYLRVQMGVTLDESTPEPDLAVVIWPRTYFQERHPTPGEIGLIVEVADTTLPLDLGPKRRSYARNGVSQYWVADLANRQLHVFSDPSGPTDMPAFGQHRTLTLNDQVSLNILDKLVAEFAVRDLFGVQG